VGIDDQRAQGDANRGVPSRGVRTVVSTLPNGRGVWLGFDPPPASALAVNHLAQVAEETARWRGPATQVQSEAITRLSRTIPADAQRLVHSQLDRARALRRRIVAGDRQVDRKLVKAAEDLRSRVKKQLAIERETVRRLGRRGLWDRLVVASAFPLFVA